MMTVKADGALTLSAPQLLLKVGLEPGGKVQKAIDNAVIRWCMKYAPFVTGTLAKSPYTASVIGSGEVVYSGPYARYLYYGQVYGPNIPVFEHGSVIPTRFWSPPGKPKYPTGKQLSYNTDYNPLAGSFWFERMKAAHSQDILREAMSVAGSN